MRKVNVLPVISDHLATLVDDRTAKRSWGDIVLFYAVPLLAGLVVVFVGFEASDEVFSMSIAVAAVFAALLFSAQIGVYTVSLRSRSLPDDPIARSDLLAKVLQQEKLFSQVNANISYLILISCLILVIMLVLLAVSISPKFELAVLVVMLSHFVLTLLMIIKRTHIAFKIDYISRNDDRNRSGVN